jgi:hypothetical protein
LPRPGAHGPVQSIARRVIVHSLPSTTRPATVIELSTNGVPKWACTESITALSETGINVDLRELCRDVQMSERATIEAIAELERKGFIVNLTPERKLCNAVFRLTCFPFQGQPATEDYTKIPLTPEEQRRLDQLDKRESKLNALRRRGGSARR